MRRTILLILLLAIVPTTASALQPDELLSLVAMPLAVSAVADVAGVPVDDLMSVVSMLNQADVPPPQFIEVVRYIPVALVVENDEPDFVEFVRLQTDQGIRSDALVTVIERRIQTIAPEVQVNFVPAPQQIVVVEQADFVPVVVRTRVIERKAHPHGGPPGQIKKQIGVQTGAEVVHGERKGRGRDDDRTVRVVRVDDNKPKKVTVVKVDDGGGKGNKGNKGQGGGGGNNGKGGGKGKGKGKD